MGFSFDRAGAAGGKIHRQPKRGVINTDRGSPASAWINNNSFPTSPQGWLNQVFSPTGYITNAEPAFSISVDTFGGDTTTQTQLSFTAPSNYWVDLVGINIRVDGGLFSSASLIVNGNNIQYVPMIGAYNDTPHFVMRYDVFGYGVSVTFNFGITTTGNFRAYGAMMPPATIITASGLVVHPPGLAGLSAVRDI